MEKDKYGVWSVTVLPTALGECAIPHDSKLKVYALFYLLSQRNTFMLRYP